MRDRDPLISVTTERPGFVSGQVERQLDGRTRLLDDAPDGREPDTVQGVTIRTHRQLVRTAVEFEPPGADPARPRHHRIAPPSHRIAQRSARFATDQQLDPLERDLGDPAAGSGIDVDVQRSITDSNVAWVLDRHVSIVPDRTAHGRLRSMRGLVQRVIRASVEVAAPDGSLDVVGSIGPGLCVLVGATHADRRDRGGEARRQDLAPSGARRCRGRDEPLARQPSRRR